MSTFSCRNECETFCKEANTGSCSFNRQLVKFHSLPNKWPWSKSKNYKPSEKELDQLDEVLSSLNPSLIKNIEGFFIIERPSDIFSIGTPASYFEGQLIIYKSAFEDPIKLKNIIVHELGHHLHETTEKKIFLEYKNIFDEKNRKFLTPASSHSHEEDFATNFEIYILNPTELKTKISTAYLWFNKKIGNKYNLRKCK